MGEHANDYAEIAAKDKLSELQLRVRQLIEQVEQIQKEQNYQRVRNLKQPGQPSALQGRCSRGCIHGLGRRFLGGGPTRLDSDY